VSSEEADHQRALVKKGYRRNLHVILVEEAKPRGAAALLQANCSISEAFSSAVARCVFSIASCGAL
jgi:hypothetical protein